MSKKLPPVHPGEVLREEFLRPMNLSAYAVARAIADGVALLKQCYGQLRQAEQRIQELVGVDEEGNPLTKPFDHASSINKKS